MLLQWTTWKVISPPLELFNHSGTSQSLMQHQMTRNLDLMALGEEGDPLLPEHPFEYSAREREVQG